MSDAESAYAQAKKQVKEIYGIFRPEGTVVETSELELHERVQSARA